MRTGDSSNRSSCYCCCYRLLGMLLTACNIRLLLRGFSILIGYNPIAC